MPRRKPNYFRIDGIESRVFDGDIPKQSYGRFRHSPFIAIDLEYQTESRDVFNIETTKLAAIQFAAPGLGVVIVRVQKGQTPTYALQLFRNNDITKLFHYAFGDCTLIQYHWKTKIENVACTKIAAKVLFDDPNKSTSLKDLLPHYLHISVSKQEQLSDWMAPKLTVDQIEYATRDVLYLCPLYDHLVRDLSRAGKLPEVQKIWKDLPQIVEDEVSGKHKKENWSDPIIQYK